MLEELRLNPRSPEARSCGRVLGERALTEDGRLDPSLSTGYAERAGAPFHSGWRGVKKEEVG